VSQMIARVLVDPDGLVQYVGDKRSDPPDVRIRCLRSDSPPLFVGHGAQALQCSSTQSLPSLEQDLRVITVPLTGLWGGPLH